MAATELAWVFLDVPPDAHDAARLFWTRVLGEEPVQDPDNADYALFPTPLTVRVGLQRIGDGDAGRVYLDLAADDVDAEDGAWKTSEPRASATSTTTSSCATRQGC